MPFATSLLVPTDFSSKSENAIRYACEIASNTGGEVHFLNVLEEPYDFPSRVEEVIGEKKKENEQRLSKMIQDLHSKDEFRIIQMKGMVQTGKVLSTTQNIANEYGHDLIVIGLGGQADLKKVLYGSITNNLLMTSDVPVLAISKRIDYREPKKLLFATDMRRPDLPHIKKMREFSVDIGVSLEFVHIADPQNPTEPGKIGWFNTEIQQITKNPATELILHEAPSFSEGITELIGDDKHTLLVMTRYKNKFLEWLLSNSTVRSIAQMASVPLLMIPADV